MNLDYPPTVIRTDWGLTIAGTRITLYQIMDFLKADFICPKKFCVVSALPSDR